jgi:hypothetical protein
LVVALPYMVVGMIQAEVKKRVGRKELALLGQSSVAWQAGGGSDWSQSGGEQVT